MSQPTLNVSFLDADSGSLLTRAKLPAPAMPERMFPSRRIELKGVSYAVVSSDPVTREQAVQSGRVEVRLRRVPADVYTVPTLAEELPRLDESQPRQGRMVELDGDEWGQLACFGAVAAPRVAEQLERIAAVRDDVLESGFYPRLHIRTQLPPLLKGVELPLSAVAGTLPGGTLRLDGIVIDGEPGVVKDGFGFLTMSGLELYGVAPREQVKVLAVRRPAEPAELGVEAMGLSVLMLQHGLSLVDWVGARTAGADAGEVERLIGA